MEEGCNISDTFCGVSFAKNIEQNSYSVQLGQQIQVIFPIYLPLR